MPDVIHVNLSRSWTASAAGITVDYPSGRRGSPICALARKLVEAEHDPAAELHVYRGEMLCFKPVPLAKWAGLVVEEGDNTRKSARFFRTAEGVIYSPRMVCEEKRRQTARRNGRAGGNPRLRKTKGNPASDKRPDGRPEVGGRTAK